jgi:redox-sensitive bicupin YhaK (pirin superfamily)
MTDARGVFRIFESRPTIEGAGVRLRRAFGGPDMGKLFDPFLLLDDFGSRFPHEYLAGFPWHPHRGIETVTYLIKGEVNHEDSTGTKGVIKSGEIQWMTAGSGIFHAEMPRPGRKITDGREVEDPEMKGLQLWVNLPTEYKMSEPKYRNLSSPETPVLALDDGTSVRLVSGKIERVPGTGTVTGPVSDLSVPVHYLDITMMDSGNFEYRLPESFNAFAYLMEGEIYFDGKEAPVRSGSVVLFDRGGGSVKVRTRNVGARFLLIAGKPLNQPIAWYGPIVMNTQNELQLAIDELRNGSFIKSKATTYDYFRY